MLESIPVHMWAGGRNTHRFHQQNTHRSLRPTTSGNLDHPNGANQANVHLFGHVGGILRTMGNPRGSETRTFWDPRRGKRALLPNLYLRKQSPVRLTSDKAEGTCKAKAFVLHENGIGAVKQANVLAFTLTQ